MEILYVVLLLGFSPRCLILCLVRLENEHLGYTDWYHVTREVPFLYVSHDDPDGDVGKSGCMEENIFLPSRPPRTAVYATVRSSF